MTQIEKPKPILAFARFLKADPNAHQRVWPAKGIVGLEIVGADRARRAQQLPSVLVVPSRSWQRSQKAAHLLCVKIGSLLQILLAHRVCNAGNRKRRTRGPFGSKKPWTNSQIDVLVSWDPGAWDLRFAAQRPQTVARPERFELPTYGFEVRRSTLTKTYQILPNQPVRLGFGAGRITNDHQILPSQPETKRKHGGNDSVGDSQREGK